MDTKTRDIFNRYWAVVVNEQSGSGRRLLWSASEGAWLPSHPYGSGFIEAAVERRAGKPRQDEVGAAITLTDRLAKSRICQRCGLSRHEEHFVAPDIFGNAALYCVQQPDPRVIGSFGGNGKHKHWGSSLGCSSVRGLHFTDDAGERYVDYGEGLVASHVRDWEWCSRCVNSASNIANHSHALRIGPWTYARELERRHPIRTYPYAI